MFFGMFYSLAAMVVLFVAFWGIIFGGRYPRKLWDYGARFFRYNCRVNAYGSLLTDAYPPFHGKEEGLYPVRTQLNYPVKSSRLQALFRGVLIIPQLFYGAGYSFVVMFIYLAVFIAVLFAGRIPDGFWRSITRYFVWSSRLNAWSLLLTDEYPPFHGLQPLAVGEAFEAE
jgi:hypothetical protein